MTALSIHLPEKLAKKSFIAAQKLGISRSEFIRQTIHHELDNLESRMELEAMTRSFSAMKKHPNVLKEIENLDIDLSNHLPDEEDE